ncbi:Uncharacterized protein YjbI, contains pentapeptide repeats [Cohaesibacter marisflavi]|uniref:Uncharacterized protein YjbI, contains pentapeptide repeats n=1 Tax=Cohaesibacter marisflavi TaxID=655353 RepID=A0A1I5H998_9HYPH|nr:pentapeptide repeat-containing protein [Cohaesibacter marisflavi]SFO44777.1 Uncharacterized protein YjbI, contains pentapeptide repeats [Cohaesibacter marisflavi]
MNNEQRKIRKTFVWHLQKKSKRSKVIPGISKRQPPISLQLELPPQPDPPWWDHKLWGSVLRIGEFLTILAGLIATAFAIASLKTANEQTRLARMALDVQRENIKEQTTIAAWQILASPSPSAPGRRYALVTLMDLVGGKLSGLDLSCSAINRIDEKGVCTTPPNFDYLHLQAPKDENWFISESNFSDNSFYYAKFDNLSLYFSDLSRTGFSQAVFNGGTLTDIKWSDSDLQDAKFRSVKMGNIDFTSSFLLGADIKENTYIDKTYINISGASLCFSLVGLGKCLRADQDFFDHAWFYADDPPTIFGPMADLNDFLLRAGCVRPPKSSFMKGGAARRLAIRTPRIPDNCVENAFVRLGDIARNENNNAQYLPK